MKFAFCLFKYFPYGGQQKDFLKVARACLAHGHKADVYTASWEGDIPDGLHVIILPVRGFTNHGKRLSLAKSLIQHTSPKKYDVVIGFNKMPDLDIYFASDSCFAKRAEEKGFPYRLTCRYRTYLSLENAVFNRSSKTQILLLSKHEKDLYTHYYNTQEARLHLLPPGIPKKRTDAEDSEHTRVELRQEMKIAAQNKMVLMVGSGFKTKGVDRSIKAVAALPHELRQNTTLVIVGKGHERPFQRLAKKNKIASQVLFTGGRKDVTRFFSAADLLIHPSYRESAGMVLIEAMASCLPVLVTDVCGYSFHIEKANAGMLVPSPFKQETLNRLLEQMLTSDMIDRWRKNGGNYVSSTDVYGLAEKAAIIIEQVGKC